MKNPRTYGEAPFRVAVIHGGPGAPGEVAPVARELAGARGVLEPLQTASSVAGQVEELQAILQANADLPVTLIGFSWGAWLGLIFAANHPALVRKLILVASGPFEEPYADAIQKTRLSRLNEDERRQVRSLTRELNDPAAGDKDVLLAQFGRLFTKADAYRPLTLDTDALGVRWDIHQRVWSQAAELRRSGKLLELAGQVQCPVVAIHGDYDPHPAEGVRAPLSVVAKDFRFILLEHCGHIPWIEAEARDTFYGILRAELR